MTLPESHLPNFINQSNLMALNFVDLGPNKEHLVTCRESRCNQQERVAVRQLRKFLLWICCLVNFRTFSTKKMPVDKLTNSSLEMQKA